LKNFRIVFLVDARGGELGVHFEPGREVDLEGGADFYACAVCERANVLVLGRSSLLLDRLFIRPSITPDCRYLLFLFFCLTGVPDSLTALRRRTAAAAVYFTASSSSDMYSSTVSRTEGSPRPASASSAAARTTQLLSSTASISALVVSGSLVSTLAAGNEQNAFVALFHRGQP